MENELIVPKTLQQAILHYSDEDRCLELLMAARWSDGVVTCPYCESKAVGFVKSRRLFQCKNKECRKQFSIKIGTYMEDSPLPLSTWMAGMWLITNAKNGISSCEISRSLGITQKTAWFMLHRIRLSFGDGQDEGPMSGTIEADETYIGGLEKNKHKSKRIEKAQGRSAKGKTVVFGLLERRPESSYACVRVVDDAGKKSLQSVIRTTVAPGSEVYTDNWVGYKGLTNQFVHEYVDHAVEYVRGNVHTNGLENFWSLLKRMVKGTYVAVSPWHLQRYVEEETFRFNERKADDATRFQNTVAGAYGKRLTWKQLTYPAWAAEEA